MAGLDAALLIGQEEVWGENATLDRAIELDSETLKANPGRILSNGIRRGNRVQAKPRQVPYIRDASGDFSAEVLTKGFGLLFLLAMGDVSTSGPGVHGEYTHTFTLGDLTGLSATIQKLVPDASGTSHALTYLGSKVTSLALELAADSLLMGKWGIDAAAESTSVSAGTPTYASGAELMSFVGGTLTVDGDPFASLKKVGVNLQNALATDRRVLGGTFGKLEPIENGFRTVGVDLEAEFTDLDLYNKFKAETPNGVCANISVTFQGPTTIGGTVYPSITFDMPNVSIDGETPQVNGLDIIQFKSAGKALNSTPGTNDALTITLVTADALP